MKKRTKITIILAVMLLVVGVLSLSACSGKGNENAKITYTADDIVYVAKAGDIITNVSGRNYKKTNNGTAAVAIACINGYTGPVLVGKTAGSVSYIFNYNGTNVVDKYGMLTVDGIDWYYSLNIGFMAGYALDFNNKLPIYCSNKETAEEVAKELIAILDKEKLDTPISTVEQLKAIANTAGNYSLANDIDLSGESSWQPIENFSGYFNGNGYSIKNLTINAVNAENIGLFATLSGEVENLKIENAQITARGDVEKAGIIAGTNKGKISKVSVSGSINPQYYSYVGGIVGYNNLGKIADCTNAATVTGADNVGGIAGYVLVNTDNAVTSCINEGVIEGKNNVGGIAGYLTCVRSNATYEISNNTNKNTITGDNQVGGIFGYVYAFYESETYIGYSSYFSMSLLTNTAEINGSSTGSNVGGLIGKAARLTLLTTCENTADVTGGTCVGGYVGYAPDTNIKAAGAKNNSTITGKGKIGGFAGQAGIIENAINNGEIVSTGVIVENSNSRAYVGGIAGYCTGLIGCENNIDIKIENNGDYVGGLAGYVIVSKSNCVDNNINYGTVTGYNYVGGIAGYLTCVRSNATYQTSNNTNKNTVQGNDCVGGIFGYVYAFYQKYDYRDYYSYFEVVNSTNEAEIVGVEKVGGICGGFNRLKTDANLMDTNTTLYGDKLGQ